jgi:hypothetical protein
MGREERSLVLGRWQNTIPSLWIALAKQLMHSRPPSREGMRATQADTMSRG